MFENLDVVLLARIQFAFTISFHIIFPAFTIGLASWLAVVEGMWLKTKNPVYRDIYKFWIKIFAVSFGMGVVSGVVMSYQFGTNWSVFSDKVGNVIGPLLGYEVLTAFFLEASFLGIMLFGWDRVGPKMHFASTVIVAVGTLISAFWILSANSWMHTPQGFEIREDGLFYPTSWMEVIFNPSFPYRFMHMVTGAYLTTAFVVGGVGAWYLLRDKYREHAKIMLAMAIIMAFFVAPFQAFLGDLHGLNTLEHQPAKIAAIEALWETERGAALTLIGIPDSKNAKTNYAISIPKFASLLLAHDADAELKGLADFPENERPPVGIIFYAFRVMVGIGVLMIATGITGAILYFCKRLFTAGWFHRWCMVMAPTGFIAVLAGWFTTEIGRQPFLVYGVMRTAEGISPVEDIQVLTTLIMLVVVYILIFGAGMYYIFKLIRKGPIAAKHTETFGAKGFQNPLVVDAAEDIEEAVTK